jgi:APA family basic amino acid/polyamine antiporter
MNLFARKPVTVEEASDLRRKLGPVDLILLGVGAVIGTGIFAITPIQANAHAGPAVVFSFIIGAFGCVLAGMCYSEFSTMIPVAGSAYTYAYATMGELVAWIIGWDLILEYAVGAATISVSWSDYLVRLLGRFGLVLPKTISAGPLDGGIVNLPAIFVICLVSLVLIIGIQSSARVNGAIVVLKVAIVLLVIFLGWGFIDQSKHVPFLPPNQGQFGHFGISGMMRAAAVLFFAYSGFDAVSTAAQESRRPQRDMPIGLFGSLFICTGLYVLFSWVLTGIMDYRQMTATAIYDAMNRIGYHWLSTLILVGILIGYISVMLVMLFGQSRIFYSMSRDGLLPRVFSDVHPGLGTPWRSNLILMTFCSLFAGFLPLSNLTEMTSIGTLLAFVIVCAGVIVMRRTYPDAPRPYRTPLVPFIPVLGIVVCFTFMTVLEEATWIRLIVWLITGIAIYFSWSRYHSHLQRGIDTVPSEPGGKIKDAGRSE